MVCQTAIIGVVCLLSLAFSASVSEAARALHGSVPYIQCGGMGGICKGELHRCQDAPWPLHDCLSRSTCRRRDANIWLCESKTNSGPAAMRLAPEFKQCGGSGGGCTGAQCQDAQWPGVTCASGEECYRENPYYWQCNTQQVAMQQETAYTASDFKQCGGTGGSCMDTLGACQDAQTGTCRSGLVCKRENAYEWNCQSTDASI